MGSYQHTRDQGGRPGAMTAAMAAVRAAEGPKVLRIGVIEGTRIVEERVVRERGPVSVGSTEQCTFVLAAEGAPARVELFSLAGDRYRLNFTDAMEGRVALATGVHTLAELRADGRASRTNAGWQLPLSEQARGKVTLGGVTILFQFVAPPPAAARPQLPVAIRARPMKNLDWSWNACLAFFACVAFAGAAYAEYGYDPIVEDNFADLASPIVREILPPATPDDTSDEGMATPPDNTAPATPSNAPDNPTAHPAPHPAHPGPSRPSPDHAVDNAVAAAQRAADAASHALDHSAQFAALTGTLANGHSANDTLAQGGFMNGSVRELAQTTGVLPANGANAMRPNTGNAVVASNTLGNAHTLQHGSDAPGTGTVSGSSDAPIGHLALTAPVDVQGDGDVSGDAVGDTIRHNLGGIRQCYTVALRNHPTLAGRLEVHFTIGTSGRVAGAPDASGMAEAPEVGRCVENRIRYLVFPQPRGGSVQATIPFGFTPGGG